MSRKSQNHRVSRSCGSQEFSSRANCLYDTPLWLILYWLDLAIVSSGFFSRRRLLRLRNDLLDFLRAPSGDAWFVRVNNKTRSNHV